MTTTITALEHRLERLRKQSRCFDTRLLVLVLEAGQEIPAPTLATLRPGDQIIIEEIPAGYFGNLEDKEL